MQVLLAQNDRSRWLKNALIFLAPLGILYLIFVQANIQNDGFAWSDFAPSDQVIGGGFLYLINTILDYLRKLRG